MIVDIWIGNGGRKEKGSMKNGKKWIVEKNLIGIGERGRIEIEIERKKEEIIMDERLILKSMEEIFVNKKMMRRSNMSGMREFEWKIEEGGKLIVEFVGKIIGNRVLIGEELSKDIEKERFGIGNVLKEERINGVIEEKSIGNEIIKRFKIEDILIVIGSLEIKKRIFWKEMKWKSNIRRDKEIDSNSIENENEKWWYMIYLWEEKIVRRWFKKEKEERLEKEEVNKVRWKKLYEGVYGFGNYSRYSNKDGMYDGRINWNGRECKCDDKEVGINNNYGRRNRKIFSGK